MTRPVGSGFPVWLDTERYLNGDEVRAFGMQLALSFTGGLCPACHKRPVTDKAHIWRGGMSGRSGPCVGLCRPCHTGDEGVDRRGDRTLAVEREPVPVLHLMGMERAHRVVLLHESGSVYYLGYLPTQD